MADLNPGHGYAELGGGFQSDQGAFAWAEAGYHVTSNLDLFAKGDFDSAGWSAVGGLRVNW